MAKAKAKIVAPATSKVRINVVASGGPCLPSRKKFFQIIFF